MSADGEPERRSLAQLFRPFAQGVLSDVLAKKPASKPTHTRAGSASAGQPTPLKRQSISGAPKVSPTQTPPPTRGSPSPSPQAIRTERSEVRFERERSNSLPPLPLWEVGKAVHSAPDLLGPAVAKSRARAESVASSSSSPPTSTPSSPKNQTDTLSQSSDSTASTSTSISASSSAALTGSASLSASGTAPIPATLSSSSGNAIPASSSASSTASPVLVRQYTEREKLMKPDAEQAVYRSPRKSDGKMVIVAAPFDQLLAALTDESGQDKDLLEHFLLTHPYFIESIALLDRLVEKFTQAANGTIGNLSGSNHSNHSHSSLSTSASGVSSSPSREAPLQDASSPRLQGIHVQLKLINILKKWIELNVDDFDDPVVQAQLVKTLATMASCSSTASEWVSHLSSLLAKQRQIRATSCLSSDTSGRPKPHIPKVSKPSEDLVFMDIHPVEFARQLTLYEHERIQRISLKHFYHKGWSRPGSASEVCQLIDQFNRVSFWVASEIVTMPNHKHRTAVIARFIEIAVAMQEMGNYNGLMEIISGLNLHVVQRLKLSWKALSAKHVQTFAQTNEIMDPKCNWQTYRAILAARSGPVLPFLGLHLTDLTFIEESPDRMPNGVINFEKMTQLGRIFQDIRRCQATLYNFESIPQVFALLKQMKPMSEEQLWMSSKMCEPSQENPR